MNKEIGSEFYYNIEDIVDYIHNHNEEKFFKELGIDSNNSILLDSGRSCIKYLLESILDRKVNKVLLPSFLCNSIVNAIASTGIDIEFYNVNSDLIIDIEDMNSKLKTNNDIIYFINYFGFYQPNYVYEYLMKLKYTNLIIEDCTHTLFSRNCEYNDRYIGHFQIASIRKWFGIPDGAVLFSKSINININENIIKSGNNDFAIKKFVGQLLKGNYIKEGNCNKQDFMNIIKDALLTNEINSISDVAKIILLGKDYENLKIKRKLNYNYLYKELSNKEFIKPIFNYIDEANCPLGFPIKVKNNRDEFRNYLASNNIYCPVHWNSYKHIEGHYNESEELANMILTIPCDQRYSKEDMKYIVDIINLYNND